MTKALVIGAGIVGLCTAEVLSRKGISVEVVSASPHTMTTSAAAVSVLTPFFPGPPDTEIFQRMLGWARETIGLFEALETSEPFLEEIQCFEFGLGDFLETGFHVDKLKRLDFAEFTIKKHRPLAFDPRIGEYDFSVGFRCRLCNTHVVLDQLAALLIARGVVFRNATFEHEAQVRDAPADILFNCMGIGSVFPDPELYPVLGQSTFIPAIARSRSLFGIGAGHHAVFSHRRGFYVGSYFMANQYSVVPLKELYDQSQLFVRETFPTLCEELDLRPPKIDFNRAARVNNGVRPFRRSGPRVEREDFHGRPLIHNYGHGAHGWTIGYATAAYAVALADI